MGQIFNQLSELFLGSLPTIVLFVLLIVAYGYLVRQPLDKVLAERRARTSGAVEQARGAMNAAEAETAVFEDKLRAAKAEIFAARDGKRRQWADERDRVLEETRNATSQRVSAALLTIEQSKTQAYQQIESLGDELSTQILKSILPQAAAAEAAQ